MASNNTIDQIPAPCIPIEVFENVIDSLYSTPLDDQLQSSDALRSCALVCRAWPVRAQMMLFHSVVLSDAPALYRFSTALDLGQHLSSYVRELILTGRYLHTTTSILALFPSILRGKVPNLSNLQVIHIPEDADWYPKSPVEARQRKLQCVPLHSRFPLLLSSRFLPIKHLHLEDVTFRFFSDFVHVLDALRTLQSLVCYNVRWITLGGLPACMARRQGRAASQASFAPNLEELLIKSLGIYGAERLVSALGPRLVELCVGVPYFDPSERPPHPHASPTTGLGIDLGHCPELEWLYIGANPTFLTYGGSAELVTALLHSWRPKTTVSGPVVIFFTNDAQAFTRDTFVDVLRALGRITEDWFRDVAEVEDGRELRQSVKVRIYDQEKWRGWWWGHVQTCFPTWVRLKRLEMEYLMPRNEDDIWRSEV